MPEQAIEIVDYSPHWPALFASERELLRSALSAWLAGMPEHIGSTAVPGLAAKPVIDIMAPVRSLKESAAAIDAAMALGYLYYPYKADEMHWFCKPDPLARTHHLHLVPLDSQRWRDHIAFRDALRADASLRTAYESLKRSLAELHRDDREAYTAAKGPFIRQVLQQRALAGEPTEK
ncbi:MAG: GrpB family protein [Uliginosibacterium sp.]|nr:GrpB family protein [Uliginosibacterium sp.]